MNYGAFMGGLQPSGLYAECTHCHLAFKLSDAELFVGTGIFPGAAEIKLRKMLEGIALRMN